MYSPEQNGVAELMNSTVVPMARSLLNARGLLVHYWGEEVAAVVYLLNISPTKVVSNKTQCQAWMGQKQQVIHLKVFGCVAYALVNLLSNLDEKPQKCIFICYNLQSKAYRLYNPTSGKVIITSNVVFNEESAWEWNDLEEDSIIHIRVHTKVGHTWILETTSSDLSSLGSRNTDNAASVRCNSTPSRSPFSPSLSSRET